MKKRIYKISGLLIIAAVVTVGAALAARGKNDVEEKVFAGEHLAQINADMQDWSIQFEESADDNIYVQVKGEAGAGQEAVAARQEGEVLLISQNRKVRDFISNFTFGKENVVVVLLPKDQKYNVDIRADSGEVKLEGGSISELKVENKSGSCSLKNMKVTKADIVADSGDVYLRNVAKEKLLITTKSGEVISKNTLEEGKCYIDTKSGDVSIMFEKEPEDLSIEVYAKKQEVTVNLKNLVEEINKRGEYKGKTGETEQLLEIKSENGYVRVQ